MLRWKVCRRILVAECRSEGPPLVRVDGLDLDAMAFSLSTRCLAKRALKRMDTGRRLRLGNSVFVSSRSDRGPLTEPRDSQ